MQDQRPSSGDAGGQGGAKGVSGQAVRESVEEAKFHAEFEGSRLDGLHQRSGWLLAFDGVIISLIASQAHEMLDKSKVLGSVGRWIAAGALAVGVICALVSVACALAAIVKSRTWRWSTQEIEDLGEASSLVRCRVEIEGIFLNGLIERIKVETRSAKRASRYLNRAFGALCAALIAVSLYIGVYAVRTVENPCTGTSTSKSNSVSAQQSAVPPFAISGIGFYKPHTTFASTALNADSPFRKPKGESCPR